ncbi:MAG: hypothetical protein US96_C0001G0005 [Candidatus Woesebacteria bacterium GW2011_GWB1_38_5b]|uniref:Translation elongation factor-like protein n=1 Tax=Candidatus Woesebacteria bacterium GW2011_GWB1_38_5b TaxID=1618569 RepID=A0A0G0MQI3_9BACT|nr:MAG: hypothetical protein US96_C0001G0005 [Candidatus Woesebacteria bacterium GW2011_GWB1_38_5b]
MHKIGTVTHYYDKISVAIVELTGGIKLGDKIKFVRGGEDLFDQNVDSIQIEHKEVNAADKGDSVGIKTAKEVKSRAEVFKI